MGATRECYEPENKRTCTEPERERMSDDLMKLNDTELIHINFGDKTDSDNASNDSDNARNDSDNAGNDSHEDFFAKKAVLF